MKYKAILFDLDGTLLNTISDIGTATNAALLRSGYGAHPIGDYENMVGHGLRNLVSKALPAKSAESEIDAVFKATLQEYEHCYAKETHPYPGIESMLKQLKEHGVRLSILSNKNHEFTVKIVDTLLAKWNFEFVYGSRDGIPKKPDPQGAIEIARLMKLEPSEFLFLGDSSTDVKTALACGMFPVGVSWGYRSAEDIKSAGAEVIIENPDELLKILK